MPLEKSSTPFNSVLPFGWVSAKTKTFRTNPPEIVSVTPTVHSIGYFSTMIKNSLNLPIYLVLVRYTVVILFVLRK